jgi:hypothetical protein
VSDRCMKGMVFKDLVMYSIKKIKINQHKIWWLKSNLINI